MKVLLLGEDFPDGEEVDWPAVPRVGDMVTILGTQRSAPQRVEQVFWHSGPGGALDHLEVHLRY